MTTEREDAIRLAHYVLDSHTRDPDETECVLARQLLHAIECGEADKTRLDWLDEVNRNMNEHYGSKYGWRYDINHNRAAMLSDHHWPALTIREAIDAARKPK